MLEWIIELLLSSFIVSALLSTLIFGCIYMYKKNKGRAFEKKVITFIFLFYLICLLYVTVYREGLFMNSTRTVNLIPFEMLIESYEYSLSVDPLRAMLFLIYNIVGNIAWFVPLGFMVNFYLKKPYFWKAFGIAFGLSFTIELLQFIGYVGITDIDDLIFNTIGGCIGYGIYRFIYRRQLCQLENK
ncbi:VanZ family protein [Breznakia pachnodae]|uniref:Glycopeptide antibiotics resistance protein n=1 Tax=Breznakia pachnodae TaxID=265178 RepID=A0ABU0E4Q6_9FIRM|nr:VanZ family protein [Breznakia pachnodae]MDQ0361673.1 glycopeptide antibiotics resistance protein [Breznakia pachnodae]